MFSLFVLPKLLIVGTWLVALTKLWRFRGQEHANLAIVGALSMVLSGGMVLFDAPVAPEILLFFISIAQLTIGISLTKLVRYANTNQLQAEERICYSTTLLTICGAGVLGTILPLLPHVMK